MVNAGPNAYSFTSIGLSSKITSRGGDPPGTWHHRFVGNAIYEVPFLKTQHGLAGRLLASWELGLILSV